MADNNKSFPKFKNLSPINEAMINRLVADPRQPIGTDKKNIDPSIIGQIFKKTSRESTDIRNIFKILPWMHLPREILISSIVSPGDMIQVILSISNTLKDMSPSLSSKLDKVLKDFFIDECGMETKIYDWVDEAMISQGAHPIMIIPEASLDKIINGGMTSTSFESIASFNEEYKDGWFKPKGILGIPLRTATKTEYVSFESVQRSGVTDLLDLHTIKHTLGSGAKRTTKEIKLPITVTDNLAVFRKPLVDKVMKSNAVEKAYGQTAFEAVSKKYIDDREIEKRFFRRPKSSKPSRLEVVPVTKAEDNIDLGHPLTYHLPVESVVPIFVPGDSSNHTHYIVIADVNGYPVSYARQLDFYSDIRSSLMNTGSESQDSGEIIQLAKETLGGSISDIGNGDIDKLTHLHSNIIETDIVNRIRSGLTGGEVEFTMPMAVKRLMLARSLANKRTTLILVPADYMVYMAYNYNEFGVGTSILEDGKGWLAQTAAVHVANVLGNINNAIPGKDINIELDPDDGTPFETVQFMAREALALQHRQFPYSIGTTSGLTEQLQLSAFNINVTGNSRFPETKATISPRESTQVTVDTDFTNGLKEDIVKLFGLTPEMVDNVNQPDFATTAVNNSLLLLKRVMVGQLKTNPFLTDYVRLFTYNSGILLTRLLNIVEDNKKEIPKGYKNALELVEAYVNNVVCALPKPQTENVLKQAEMLEKMSEAIDKFLDAHFKKEYLAGFDNPAIEESFDVLRESWKGMLMRKWMRDHGVFRDLDVFTSSEDGSKLADLNEEMVNYTKVMRESIGDWYKKIAKYVERHAPEVDKAVEAGNKAKYAEPVEEEEESPTDEYELDNPPEDDDFDIEPETDEEGGEPEDVEASEEPDETEESDDDTDPLADEGLDNPPE